MDLFLKVNGHMGIDDTIELTEGTEKEVVSFNYKAKIIGIVYWDEKPMFFKT